VSWLHHEMAAMRVLCIGGSGLQGAPTVRQLLAAGHDVSVLSRGGNEGAGTGGRRPPLPDGVATIVCDRDADGAGLCDAIVSGGFEAVVDYYAMVPRHIDDVVAAYEAADSSLAHYIFVSTNMVYPGGPGGFDISPLRPTVPEELADVANAADAPDDYGGLKLKCERALADAAARCSFPYTTLRPPSVVGPACDNRHERLQRVAMGLAGLPPRGGRAFAAERGGFRIAYSEDMASAVVKTLAVGVPSFSEAFNIAQAEIVTVEEYVEGVRSALQRSGASAIASADAVTQALAELGPEVTNYVSSRPPSPLLALSQGPMFDCELWSGLTLGVAMRPRNLTQENQSSIDIEKAQRVLGWEPTPFEDFIQVTTDWHTPLLLAEPQQQPKEKL
jgi:nucleoside-diphosphate-sugar epimerase